VTKFDRYFLSQLLLFFGFFALVLLALFWITRAVRLFDRLIGDGQSALVFLEFSALSLPGLILMILPLASFAATVYVTNRLSSEAELTVMLSSGASPWRLARAVLVFAGLVVLMMSVLAHVLVPAAHAELEVREREVSRDLAAVLLKDGEFLHPTQGVTLYTRAIGEDGVLRDVFLSDRRDPQAHVIYTAATAYLVRRDGDVSLIMLNGLAQRSLRPEGRLSTATFDDFAYDISTLFPDRPSAVPGVGSRLTQDLVGRWAQVAQETQRSVGFVAEDVHARFANPLLAAATAFIGFGVLLAARFSRTGPWKQVLFAFVVLLLLDGMRAALADPVRDNAALWPVIYVPATLGALLALGLLSFAAKPFARAQGVAP